MFLQFIFFGISSWRLVAILRYEIDAHIRGNRRRTAVANEYLNSLIHYIVGFYPVIVDWEKALDHP